MKKIILTSALLMIITFGFGQKDSAKTINKKWTFGTILLSEQNYFSSKSFRPTFFNGIVIKRNLKHLTLRIGIEYSKEFYKTEENALPMPDAMYVDGYTNEGKIRLGIEKGFIIKKYFKPFIALDLTGIKSYSDITEIGGIAGVNDRALTHSIGYGATPTIGIDIFITKNLSVTYETKYQFLYIKSKIVDYDHGVKPAVYHRQSERNINTLYRIGALTINYDF